MISVSFRFSVVAMVVIFASAHGQGPAKEEFNYDEARVGKVTVPNPLQLSSGETVKSADDWVRRGRPETFKVFETLVYGKAPGKPAGVTYVEASRDDHALGGKAIRKEVTISFSTDPAGPRVNLLVFLPKGAKPSPMFLGLNFNGNHTVHADPGIALPTGWVSNSKDSGAKNNKASASGRGALAHRWQVEKVVGAGYGLATAYYGDIDPDFDDGFQNGVHPLFHPKGKKPGPDEWGSIAAWAWGLSRALDYLETEPGVDAKRVAVLGHSRLGKTALWAGACDTRFALVISNNSGCGGAALNRRWLGETVARINTSFPHWFCDNFLKYNGKENDLPVDQHQLIALIAPRPVYIASAAEDLWADPKGEYLAGVYASPVYELFGKAGLTAKYAGDTAQQAPAAKPPTQADFMPFDQPLMDGSIGYHLRTGKHDVIEYDWTQFIAFANKHLGNPKP